jgi:hypothetical protein
METIEQIADLFKGAWLNADTGKLDLEVALSQRPRRACNSKIGSKTMRLYRVGQKRGVDTIIPCWPTSMLWCRPKRLGTLRCHHGLGSHCCANIGTRSEGPNDLFARLESVC